jgi:SAM-dependent methyltransferase
VTDAPTHHDGQRRLWTIGDYPAVAQHLRPVSVALLDAIGPLDEIRVLDVGCGDGNASIEAARRGAEVIGIDLTPTQIERASARAAHEGVDVEFRVGDAESLPVDEASFDVVISSLGMIFAPDHARAAAEMVRACRPGGRIGMTTWTTGGWTDEWRARSVEVIRPVDTPIRPDLWGDADEATRRWSAAGARAIRIDPHTLEWRFADVDEAVTFFFTASGPYLSFLERAEAAGRGDDARRVLTETMAATATRDAGGVTLDAPYLVITATR